MFRIIKSVINNKDFRLEDILYKINKMYVEDMLSEEEKNELDNLARSKAKMENSYDIQRQFADIYERLEKLENNTSTDEEVEVEVEEYPEYKQPAGAHDSYNIGDKVTFKEKKYICKVDGCAWSPETYPPAWEEVVESESVVE
ncbi:hypothetical protein IJD44_07595 [bacterium]|nr:hypothetical protein [bacterium]